MSKTDIRNPYVGPRPFQRADAQSFFGREGETHELLALVVAHQAVLLYAPAGAGKTSFINAGLIPLLEDEGFEVLPSARLRSGVSERDANVYASALLANWEEWSPVQLEPPSAPTLAEFLSAREHPVGPDGFPAPRAVVIDQLEELFFLYPEHWPEREGLFGQVAEALSQDRLLRVVFSLREDYLAQLDRYAQLLPDGLRRRLRLERLTPENAVRAMTAPAQLVSLSFAPGVAERVVADLLTVRVDTGSGETIAVRGEFIEPVQLQLFCRSVVDALPPDTREITVELIPRTGDVDEVLFRFYEESVAAAAAAARTREKRLRERIEEAFITAIGTRGTVYRSGDSTGGLPNAALDELERRHLVRAEFRAGARWYELTNDRLIGPIRASNQRYAGNARRWRPR